MNGELLAILPPRILWAAVQFSSQDATKLPISNVVRIRKVQNGTKLLLDATDGWRMFRIEIPAVPAEIYDITADKAITCGYMRDDELILNVAEFRAKGRLGSAHRADILDSDIAHVLNRKKGANMHLDYKKISTAHAGYTFPDLDSLIEGTESQGVESLNFDARLAQDFLGVVVALCPRTVVSLQWGKTNRSMLHFSAKLEDGVRLYCHLMPVLLRD
jgi:hypothetical protein